MGCFFYVPGGLSSFRISSFFIFNFFFCLTNISLNNENVNIKIKNNKNKIAMSDNSEIQNEKIDFINGNKTLKQECRGYY